METKEMGWEERE